MNKKTLFIIAIILILPTVILVSNSFRTIPQGNSSLAIADFNNLRVVAGVAHSVFAAKITNHLSSQDLSGVPAEQFSAEVVSSLKGDPMGKIIINQFPEGAIVYESGNAYAPGDLLKPGSTYILAALYDPEVNQFGILPAPNGYTLVSEDDSLSLDELKRVALKSRRYAELEEALKHQISLDEYNAAKDKEYEEYLKSH